MDNNDGLITLHLDGVTLILTQEEYQEWRQIENARHDAKHKAAMQYSEKLRDIEIRYDRAKTAFVIVYGSKSE